MLTVLYAQALALGRKRGNLLHLALIIGCGSDHCVCALLLAKGLANCAKFTRCGDVNRGNNQAI